MAIELKSQHEYRGYFIEQFSQLEQIMDIYLANYFVPQNMELANELISVLIDRLTFDGKRTALKNLLDKKSDKDFETKKFGNHKRHYSKLIEEIAKLGRIRNEFAHYQLGHFHDSNSDVVISLKMLRDDPTVKEYKKSKFVKIIGEIQRARQDLINLYSE